jgi:hypothetical protein
VIAGTILQLFANYQLEAAIAAELNNIKSKQFHESVYECNSGKQLNFFKDISQTEKGYFQSQL